MNRASNTTLCLALCFLSMVSLPAAATEYAFVLSTDYWSTSYYSTIGIEPPRPTDIAIEPVSTDPVAYYDTGEDMVFVVNRYLADNIQVVDPGPPFATVGQYSVGNGSNPYDIRLAGSEKAYVSRYEWTTLLIVHPYTGDSLGIIDLAPLADADGIPEMGRMEIVGNRLFVALNNIDRTVWRPAGPGKIAVIDTQADTLMDCDALTPGVQPITLELPNPYTELRYDPCRLELMVGCAGAWGELDGGVEVIDPVALQSKGVVATELGLGGDVSDAAFGPGDRWYAVVLDTAPWPDNLARLVAFEAGTGAVGDTLYNQTSGDGASLAGIEINRQQELYLCDRDVVDPCVRIFDVSADTLITRISVGVPPFDIAFLQVPFAGVGGNDGDGAWWVPGPEPGSGQGSGPGTGSDPWPQTAALSSICNSPNPFRTRTTLSFILSDPSVRVRLTIYDARGRYVRTLLDRPMAGGPHNITWDALDASGTTVAEGVYYCRLEGEGSLPRASSGMVLVR